MPNNPEVTHSRREVRKALLVLGPREVVQIIADHADAEAFGAKCDGETRTANNYRGLHLRLVRAIQWMAKDRNRDDKGNWVGPVQNENGWTP